MFGCVFFLILVFFKAGEVCIRVSFFVFDFLFDIIVWFVLEKVVIVRVLYLWVVNGLRGKKG